jgi:hypothetical protein
MKITDGSVKGGLGIEAKQVALEIEEGGNGNKEHVQVSKTSEKKGATNMVLDDAGKGMCVSMFQVEGMKKGDNGKKSIADGGVDKQGENRPEIKKFKRRPRKERAETQDVSVHLGKRRGADDMEVDTPAKTKKPREGLTKVLEGGQVMNACGAGLSEQLREQK